MSSNKNDGKPSKSALRRQREKEHRCRTILTAAEKLFSSEGYHGTNMEDIADYAEVSVGTVYFYFKNKQDLLLHLIDDVGYNLRKLVGDAFREADSTLDGIQNAGITFFRDFCLQYPEKISIIFLEAVGQSPEVEKKRQYLMGRIIKDLRQALERVAEQQDYRYRHSFSPEVMAVCILGIYERIACNYLLWEERSSDFMDVGEDAVYFTLGGIKNMIRE